MARQAWPASAPARRGAAPGAGRRCWWSRIPASSPSPRTPGGRAWHASGSPPPARPTRSPTRWPTCWWGTTPGTTALEVTARGPVVRCVGTVPLHVAVVGADPLVTVDGREVGAGHVVPVGPGQRLAVGPVRGGLRAYVAVAGGLGVPAVLGSTGTDLLARLGPGPLVAGDALGLAGRPGPMADRLAPEGRRAVGAAARRVLRVLPGPHAEWFRPGVLEELAGAAWTVEPTSSRVGLRLRRAAEADAGDGPGGAGAAGVWRRPGELDSQGMVTGAVQVPPSGEPVVLGPDHATLGGYPVAAVVIRADRWVIGQCRPGDEVSLEPVTPREAGLALAAHRRAARAVTGRYPTAAG